MNKIIEPLHVLEEAIRVLEGVEFKRQRVHVRVLGESPKFFAYYVMFYYDDISKFHANTSTLHTDTYLINRCESN